MKITYVMRSYPVLFHATVYNEIRQLRARGFEIDVFSLLEVNPQELRRDSISDLPKAVYCWKSRMPYSRVLVDNLEILLTRGPRHYLQAFSYARLAGIMGNWKAFSRFAAWAHEYRKHGTEQFHAHWATEATSVAHIFSWLTGIPFSFTAHAYDIFYQPQFFEQKLSEATFVVTVSEYNRRYIAEKFGPELIDKIHVIYPLLDLGIFSPRQYPAPNGVPSIIAIGRLTEYKGFITLIEACRILNERGITHRCQIIGEGEDRPLLEQAIDRYGLGDSVRLTGAIPHKDVPPLLESSTVYALPCVIAGSGDRDGMPMVLLEAMAREVPVVSSDVIGLSEIVTPGAGLLIPPGDPLALADALGKIFRASPEEQQQMGKAGRQVIEKMVDAAIGGEKLAELFVNSASH